MIVDVAGEHDEIRFGIRNRDGFVGFEMQVGQDANLHDGFSSVPVAPGGRVRAAHHLARIHQVFAGRARP